MNKCYLSYILFMIVSVGFGAVLALQPSIDVAVSHIFFDDMQKTFWLLGDTPWVFGISHVTSLASTALIGLAGGAWFLGFLQKKRYFNLDFRAICYLGALFVVVPVALVNFGLKDYVGRARPFTVEEFGGEKQFSPYYQVSGQCQEDCSFPSGHTTRAFLLIGFYFVARHIGASQSWQRRILAGSLLFGALAGFMRIAEGKHFLSDTLGAAFLTIFVAWGLARLMLRKSTCPSEL